MNKCDYCQHVEMCGWRKSLEERGCDFFEDGKKLSENRVIKALEQEPVLDRDCEHCSKTYGTLGCCDTVSNKWIFSCKEGQKEYLFDKIREEITDWQTDIHDNEYDAESHDFVFERIYEIIDKYKAESEDKE